MPAAEHAFGGWSSSGDMAPPFSGASVGLVVAESFAVAPLDFIDILMPSVLPLGMRLLRDISQTNEENIDPALGGPIATPNRHRFVGYPVGNATLRG
jgi:hypothetical protein